MPLIVEFKIEFFFSILYIKEQKKFMSITFKLSPHTMIILIFQQIYFMALETMVLLKIGKTQWEHSQLHAIKVYSHVTIYHKLSTYTIDIHTITNMCIESVDVDFI